MTGGQTPRCVCCGEPATPRDAECDVRAPGHTDLMVPPESLDAWLEENPPSAQVTDPLPCWKCGGEGRHWESLYGGNDPDVWDAGPCTACDGSGEQVCDNCGNAPATEKHKDGSLVWSVCRPCLDEWMEDMNSE